MHGKKLLDGVSSWWVNTIGHGRPEIGKAISQQQAQMDHVIFAGATHHPAAKLANKITELTDGLLSKVFFSDNGSTAVEVALKIAHQSWQQRGEKGRHKFLALKGSYHGDTFGAMSIAGSEGFHQAFKPLLFAGLFTRPVTVHASVHYPEVNKENIAAIRTQAIKDLRTLLEANHQEINAVIVEPLVQGAGGMFVQDEQWLREFVQTCREYKIPIILDEVFTGMGRLGANFAFQRAALQPDIVCIAKGLTGGTLPLALTLVNESFFNDFLSADRAKALLHGHSYTGNPISCNVALATLEIYKKESLIEQALQHEQAFAKWLDEHAEELKLQNARVKGCLMAFELPGTGPGNYFNAHSEKISECAAKHGLFLRPLGNTLYFAPPLSLTKQERGFALGALRDLVSELQP